MSKPFHLLFALFSYQSELRNQVDQTREGLISIIYVICFSIKFYLLYLNVLRIVLSAKNGTLRG